MIELNSKGTVSISQIVYAVIAFAVLGVVLMFLFKVDITKYFEFLPDFDANKEDKVIEGAGQEKIYPTHRVCCCFYDEDYKNTGECKFEELEVNKHCADKLGKTIEGSWVNVDNIFCFSEQICQYGYDDDDDGLVDCQDEDCDGKFCGDEKICINKECKDISVDEYADYVFYIKINDKDVTDEEVILLSAGTKYKISFGYKLEGEKAEGIDMYYLQIKDEFGTIITGKTEDVFYTGKGDEEFFYWTAKSGEFIFKTAFSKEDDFFRENIVKVIEKKVVIK